MNLLKNKPIRIAVIGAGCSGLAAVKNLTAAKAGEVVCYEMSNRIGGNWAYSPDNTFSSVCETTHIISSKKLSEFLDFPMPDDYPDYPSHAQLLAYFESYAAHFDLIRHIRFNTAVRHAEKINGEQWKLTLSDGTEEIFDYLVVANGHHHDPRYPSWPGKFTGDILHSHDYKHNRDERFINKRVLVVGAGNSGCDCAVEISRVATFTAISMRHGHYIIPKFFLGKPTDSFNAGMTWLPKFIANPMQKLSLRLMVGKWSDYGLENPPYGITEGHPTMNSELLYKIRHGKVLPRKGIERLEGKTVYFTDGTHEDYDTIVAATGYKITTPFFDKSFLDYDFDATDRVPLYLRVFHPDHPTLFFVGLVQPQGSIWPLSDAQSRVVAAQITGRWKRPDNIKQLAAQDADRISKQFTRAARHTIEVHYHEYLRTLLKQV